MPMSHKFKLKERKKINIIKLILISRYLLYIDGEKSTVHYIYQEN